MTMADGFEAEVERYDQKFAWGLGWGGSWIYHCICSLVHWYLDSSVTPSKSEGNSWHVDIGRMNYNQVIRRGLGKGCQWIAIKTSDSSVDLHVRRVG